MNKCFVNKLAFPKKVPRKPFSDFCRLFGPFSRLFSDFWHTAAGVFFVTFCETFWLLAPRLAIPPACYRSLSALRARSVPGVSPRVSPKMEGLSDGVSPGPFGPRAPECPKSVPRVSPECPGHLFDTPGTLSGHFSDTPDPKHLSKAKNSK